jgi:hypothetical protein
MMQLGRIGDEVKLGDPAMCHRAAKHAQRLGHGPVQHPWRARLASPPAGPHRRAPEAASSPSISGILMSISTTSGRYFSTAATASAPVAASPATGMLASLRIMRNPVRTSVWSSAMTTRGSASPAGPLDDLILQQGRWAQRPGEVVLSSNYNFRVPLGARLTVTGVPGAPRLTVVGIANSINQSADGWVVPGQIAALRPLLALAGIVIAAAGAMLPAGWAARTRTASALHAE